MFEIHIIGISNKMTPNVTAARGAALRGQRTAFTGSAVKNTAARMKHFNVSIEYDTSEIQSFVYKKNNAGKANVITWVSRNLRISIFPKSSPSHLLILQVYFIVVHF